MTSQVQSLIDTGPILWVPSKVWFSFISRRLKVVYDTHGKLWSRLPTNYGVVSGLFAFMMQSVIFTPPKVNSYVKEALAALNYKGNCDRFGMFFVDLQDCDRPWLIADMPEVDTIQVIRELKLKVARPRKAQPERQDAEDEARYPLGEAPTWKQIAGSLQADPTVLIPVWEAPAEVERYANCEAGSTESHAAELFICFTSHLWLNLNASWRTRPENRVKPGTIGEALKWWSVDTVLKEVIEASFKPCLSNLEGGTGRPSLSFSERRKMYFPEDGPQTSTAIWKRLGDPPGYIYKYQRVRKRLDAEGQRILDEHLEELLSLCQCLPDSSRNKSGGWIWKVDKKKILVMTNPKFYRLRRIGRKATKGGKAVGGQGLRAPPAHCSAMMAAVEMMIHENVPEEVARRAYQTSKRQSKHQGKRSALSKNRRKPPQKKEHADEGEEDTDCDDENDDNSQESANEGQENGDEGDDEDSEEDSVNSWRG